MNPATINCETESTREAFIGGQETAGKIGVEIVSAVFDATGVYSKCLV